MIYVLWISDDEDPQPCEAGPFFLEGYPCCVAHARARAASGDLGWWSNTILPGTAIAKGYG